MLSQAIELLERAREELEKKKYDVAHELIRDALGSLREVRKDLITTVIRG